jgi:type II secretory pathway pseudopilin PulG
MVDLNLILVFTTFLTIVIIIYVIAIAVIRFFALKNKQKTRNITRDLLLATIAGIISAYLLEVRENLSGLVINSLEYISSFVVYVGVLIFFFAVGIFFLWNWYPEEKIEGSK